MHSAMQDLQSCAEAVQAAASSSSGGEPKKGPVCKDGPSVTKHPSEDPISSQHKIQFFLFPVACQLGGASFPFMLFTMQICTLKHLPLILCIIKILLLLLYTNV